MAAASDSSCWRSPKVYKHHEQRKVCISRPKYREGRNAKAVKVYTINLESFYLMVQGVPAIGVMMELIQLCALYGTVEEYRPLDEYPAEEFTEVYLVKFQKLTSARAAKRNMDEKSFYGGVLHVCYVPEYETPADTRRKLKDRRDYVTSVAWSRVREKKKKEAFHIGHSSSDKSLSVSKNAQTTEINDPSETSDAGHYSSFPLLPLPPQEHQSHQRISPTEDKMGSLHNAMPETRPQQVESLSFCQTTSKKVQSSVSEVAIKQTHAPSFVPRTTLVKKRKLQTEEAADQSLTEPGNERPVIGPKLPELPKLDMNDESLNTTAALIRNTLKQVESVPEIKPVQKKIKPRRRI